MRLSANISPHIIYYGMSSAPAKKREARKFYPLHPIGANRFKPVGGRKPTIYINLDAGDPGKKEANRKRKDPDTGKQTYVYPVNGRVYIWDPTNQKIRVYLIKDRSPRTVTRTIAGQVKTLAMMETKLNFLGVFTVEKDPGEKFETITATSWKQYRSSSKTKASVKPQPTVGKLTAKKTNRKK